MVGTAPAHLANDKLGTCACNCLPRVLEHMEWACKSPLIDWFNGLKGKVVRKSPLIDWFIHGLKGGVASAQLSVNACLDRLVLLCTVVIVLLDACIHNIIIKLHNTPADPYTAELVALQSCMSAPMLLIGGFEGGRSPLKPMAWEMALAGHPDRRFVSYICTGLKEGFRIGFDHRSHPLKSAAANMFSAQQRPEIIQNYLSNELKMERLLGPLGTNHHHAIHVNRFGVIPKGNSGKWRLITDLSYPPGNSVNDGIDPKLCSLKYTSVEDVAGIAAKLGQGALMAKVDIETAYRLVPVHPQDRPLLGMEWRGDVFVDPMLPFGLRSAPKIFNAVADALECALKPGASPTCGITWTISQSSAHQTPTSARRH